MPAPSQNQGGKGRATKIASRIDLCSTRRTVQPAGRTVQAGYLLKPAVLVDDRVLLFGTGQFIDLVDAVELDCVTKKTS